MCKPIVSHKRSTMSYQHMASVIIKVEQSHYRPGQTVRFPEVEAPRFQDNRRMKVVKSALGIGRLPPPAPQEIFQVLISVRDWVNPCGRKDYVRRYSSDTTGNRTRDLPVCSAVPEQTAPPRTWNIYERYKTHHKFNRKILQPWGDGVKARCSTSMKMQRIACAETVAEISI